MDESLLSQLQAIADEIEDAAEEVESALDEHATFAFMLQTRKRLDAVVARYREAYAQLDEKDRMQLDRTTGRRLSDVQKMASRLPAAAQGKPAEKIADTGFFATRAPKS